MKRVWAVLALFAAILGLCIWGGINTRKITDTITMKLEEARTAAELGDKPKALLLSKELEESWPSYHALLCTYMPHARLESIDQNLAALPGLLSGFSTDQFIAECGRCTAQVKYLNEAERPSLENIL